MLARHHEAHFLRQVIRLGVRAFEHRGRALRQADGIAARRGQRHVDGTPVTPLHERQRDCDHDGRERRHVAPTSGDRAEQQAAGNQGEGLVHERHQAMPPCRNRLERRIDHRGAIHRDDRAHIASTHCTER
jgi:hypothetical protein